MKTIFLNILALGTLLSSVFTITSKNPVISVIFLISTFVSGAGYLILIGINFVGISYIIVYVGAIAVLFLFVIMLINIKLADITETGSQYLKNLPLALAVSSIFLFLIFTIVPFTTNNVSIIYYVLSLFNTMNSLILTSNISASNVAASMVTKTYLDLEVDTLFTTFSQIETLGSVLYTNQSILLIVLSVILLLAMFASIVLNNVNNKNNKQNPLSNLNESKFILSRCSHPWSASLDDKKKAFDMQKGTAKRNYHTSKATQLNTKAKAENAKDINPWLVTGFTDAEGCFSARLSIYQEKKYFINPVFSFHMHLSELEFINKLREFFGVGSVRTDKTSVHYQVTGINNLLVVLAHFKKYPLQSSKKHSLFIFSIILNIMAKKEHLTKFGMIKAISYINCLNKPILKENWVRINKIIGPVAEDLISLPPVPVISSLPVINPYWIVGFVMGEGSFSFAKSTYKSKTSKETRAYFSMEFTISQIKTDIYLLRSIANHIGGGSIKVYTHKPMASLIISQAKIIQNLILPFFENYPLLGNKKIQYDLWLKAVLVIFAEPNYSQKRQESLIYLLLELTKYQGRAKDKNLLAKYLYSNISYLNPSEIGEATNSSTSEATSNSQSTDKAEDSNKVNTANNPSNKDETPNNSTSCGGASTNDKVKTNYEISLDKEITDKAIDATKEVAKEVFTKISYNTAAVGAGATLGATAMKVSQGLPPAGKALVGIGTAALGTLVIKTTLELTDRALDNKTLKESSSSSSPATASPTDSSFINSALEAGDNLSSLEVFINAQHTFNQLTILIIALLLYIIFNRILFKKIMDLLKKFLPVKYYEKIDNYLKKGDEFSKKFYLVFFIINFILLLFVLAMNLYISIEPTHHIQAYVKDYNLTHGINSSIFIMSLFSSHSKRKDNFNKIVLQTKTINKFQHFPFHLVDPSPWPILTSFSLLNLTIGGLLTEDFIETVVIGYSQSQIKPYTNPSPDSYFIASIIETGEHLSSLEVLLNIQYVFNLSIVILAASLFYIIFSRYILKINMYIIKQILPTKYSEKIEKFVKKGDEYNSKFFLVIFIWDTILIFIAIAFNIYISYNLYYHIDLFVNDYNMKHSINNSIIINTLYLFFSISKKKDNLKKNVASPYTTSTPAARDTSNNSNYSAKAKNNYTGCSNAAAASKGENLNKSPSKNLNEALKNSSGSASVSNIGECPATNISKVFFKLPQQQKIKANLKDNKDNITLIEEIKAIKKELIVGLQTSYPEHINKLNNTIYLKFIRIIGAMCLFISMFTKTYETGINFILLDLFRIFSILYLIYRIVLTIYALKQMFSSTQKINKLLVRNFSLNIIFTFLKFVVILIKFLSNIFMAYGFILSIFIVIDDMLDQHNYNRFFIPKLMNLIKSLGLDKAIIELLLKIGIGLKKKSLPLEDVVSNNNTVSGKAAESTEAANKHAALVEKFINREQISRHKKT